MAAKDRSGTDRLGEMLGRSDVMRDLFARVSRMAPSTATVLITGESGTGKELVARTLHEMSIRREGPFLAVNCSAISPNLIESELFGHRRGSFTGAIRDHRGYFERASGGTLFLDEITEMPASLQMKLLRALESSRVTPVGAESSRPIDVRLLAATNRDPKAAVREGALREDLYYRLKVLQVEVPPLRRRRVDIPLLAEHFLERVVAREGASKWFTEATIEALMVHDWPGNARELRNAVYSAYLLAAGNEIGIASLPEEVTGLAPGPDAAQDGVRIAVGTSIEEAERRLILKTLDRLDGNKTRTAEVLGISVRTLYNRLHAYGAMEPGPSQSAPG